MTISSNIDFLPFVFLLGLAACSGDTQGPSAPIIFDRCEGKSISIQFGAGIPVGSSSNRLFTLDESRTLVVESGENTVSIIEDGVLNPFIDVGANRGPWSTWGDGQSIYVTNYNSNSLSEFAADGTLVREWTEGFARPSAVLGNSKHLYVSNVAFDGSVFEQGYTLVLERATGEFIQTLEHDDLNPLFLSFISYQNTDYLGVTNAGSFEFTNEGTLLGSPASFELWDLNDLQVSPIRTPLPFDPERKIGSPGQAVQVDDLLYFASATEPVLFEYSLVDHRWTRALEDPIRLRSSLPEALHFAAQWNGLIFVSAFNEDAMYIYDPLCEKVSAPISLDDKVDYLAGAHDLLISENGDGAVILSIANLVKPFTIEEIDE